MGRRKGGKRVRERERAREKNSFHYELSDVIHSTYIFLFIQYFFQSIERDHSNQKIKTRRLSNIVQNDIII